jgi:ATP-dependent protease ClpP protease subunit
MLAKFRIVKMFFMQLVPAVTELIIAEILYLQWVDSQKPIHIYINSTGTARADGETVSQFLSFAGTKTAIEQFL